MTITTIVTMFLKPSPPRVFDFGLDHIREEQDDQEQRDEHRSYYAESGSAHYPYLSLADGLPGYFIPPVDHPKQKDGAP